MALDFHRLDNNELLFSFNDQTINSLEDIFTDYTQWTGQVIDTYGNSILSTQNQATLILIIDKFIERTDLNRDKMKVSTILEFKGVLKYFQSRKIELKIIGD